ncbi:MAG: HlyD family efflux transporter periplasmic adaptor subunit [Planctomycetota bacterium]
MNLKTSVGCCLALTLLGLPAAAEDFQVENECEVHLVDDLELHATEAGILDHVAVREGSRVRVEDVLVKIDSREVEKAAEIAKYKLNAAVQRALDQVEEDYARASADVARENVRELELTIARVEGSVTDADLRQAKLEHKRAVLQIEKAQHDRKLAELDAWSLKKEYEAAEMAVDRRTLRAPFSGVVVEQYRDEKEWVNPGDPILRLVRLDQLQVEGLVKLQDHTPAELDGCEVTITVGVGRGRTEQATGRIVYINPILLRGQRAVVRAEITNREENGNWLILPQMMATMKIHLGTGGAAVSDGGPGARGQRPGGTGGRR